MPCVGLDTVSLGRNTALIPVSVSDLENPEHFRDLLFHDDPRIVLSMVSVQGDGVSLIYRANSTPGARRNAALQIAEELKGRYGVTVSRPSGFPARIPLGWDPDAKFRPDAEVVKIFSRSQESKIPDAAGKMNPNQKEGF
jgi:hypothetical protein